MLHINARPDQLGSLRGRWWLLIVVACFALAACGGPGEQDDDGTAENGQGAADGDPGGDGGGAGGGGSADGPVTVMMDGVTHAYTTGRCEIVDDVVYVIAVDDNARGQIEATLPEWDREMAYAQREGRVSLSGYVESTQDGFELVAGRGDGGTTWEWTVSGSDVQVVARMGNRSTATRDDGIEEFTEFRDVTIDIDCSGPFGSGLYAEQLRDHQFVIHEDPMQRVPGRVTVELEGTMYEIEYLLHCQFFQDQVTAEGTANEANVWLYSEGAGVHLDFVIGDRRDDSRGADLPRWGLPPDAERQDDFQFEGSDTVRSWSGTVVSEDGDEAEATITVECTDGDAFQSAGSGSLVLDGVTHVLDVVSACSIDGTTIDFYGNASETDVAVVVTGGGTDILLGDEDGQQSITRDVEFDVAGGRATWTGLLAGDRQATVAISCG